LSISGLFGGFGVHKSRPKGSNPSDGPLTYKVASVPLAASASITQVHALVAGLLERVTAEPCGWLSEYFLRAALVKAKDGNVGIGSRRRDRSGLFCSMVSSAGIPPPFGRAGHDYCTLNDEISLTTV